MIFVAFGCSNMQTKKASFYSGHELPSNCIMVIYGQINYITPDDVVIVFVDSTDTTTWIQEKGYYSEKHIKINNDEYKKFISETKRINCLSDKGRDSTLYVMIDIWEYRQQIARYRFTSFLQIREYILMMEKLFGREIHLPRYFPKEKYLNYEDK
jgi:hypothetical protein